MSELPDFPEDGYDPTAVMARVGHLPPEAQQDIEKICRILRAAFGYGEAAMPAQGRIVRIALIGPCADLAADAGTIIGYDFHITVNLPECTRDVHWCFARRLIAAEIGVPHPVRLTIGTTDASTGVLVYDARTDFPLNAREVVLNP